MLSLVEFLENLAENLRTHVIKTKSVIGKEVLDETAIVKGVVMDVIKRYDDQTISFMGYRYRPDEIKRIASLPDEYILVCATEKGRIFLSESSIKAVGSVILLKEELDVGEFKGIEKRKNEILQKYYTIKNTIKPYLEKILPLEVKREKGWLEKIMGE